MFRPRVQLEFVERYCPPKAGWRAFVQLDPADEGQSDGRGSGPASQPIHRERWLDAQAVRSRLGDLGVDIGTDAGAWVEENHFPLVKDAGDILAFHRGDRKYVIARVEERRLFRAVGQMVATSSQPGVVGWTRHLCLVVDDSMDALIHEVSALSRLDVAGVALGPARSNDRWVFGSPP